MTKALNKLVSSAEKDLSSLEEFYSKNETLQSSVRNQLKTAYDFVKNINFEMDLNCNGGLKTLAVDGFDEEQIYSQIQLYNRPLLDDIKSKIDEHLNLLKNEDFDLMIEGLYEPESENDSESNHDSFDNNENGNDDIDEENSRDDVNYDDMEDQSKAIESNGKSNVDVEEEAFMEFKKNMAPDNIDEFVECLEQHVDDLDEQELDDEALAEIYGENDTEKEKEDGYFSETGKLKSQQIDQFTKDDERSFFESQQEELLQQMEKLEEENIAEKPWQLKGEVYAWQRPRNSTLEEDLTFQHTGKSKPLITEEKTKDLESIIISRITSGIFDDPQKPKMSEGEQLRKEVELKHEKSKKSLAEIYEEQYLKLVEGVQPEDEQENIEVTKKKDEIRYKVAATLHTLNVMSSFNFVAPPVKESFNTVKNNKATPAINMEENVPISVSDATLQAPEEIMTPVDRLPKTQNEESTQDRKRRRKQAKDVAKQKAKKARVLAESVNPGKYHKERLVNEITEKKKKKEIEESKNNKKKGIEEKKSAKFSSKAFFQGIQQNLERHGAIGGKKPSPDSSTEERKYKNRL